MRWLGSALLTVVILISGCGYHLVGHGDGAGAIPEDVRTVSLIVRGGDDELKTMLRRSIASERYALVEAQDVIDQAAHAILRVTIAPVRFNPSAYDASGVATQYHMLFSGSLLLERQGKSIWQSGVVQSQGDVYVSGGPASIEASREELLEDLRKQWLQDAVGRLRSGF